MRAPHWEQALSEAIAAARDMAFAYGSHDCATWAFDVRARLLGADSPADAWRGRYTTELGAARVRKRLGWDTMQDMAQALLGDPLPHLLTARRGDMVFGQDAFGVCVGAQAAFVADAGLSLVPLRSCAMAWRV